MKNDVVYQLPHTRVCGLQWSSEHSSELQAFFLHGWLDNAASFSNLSPYLTKFSHTALDLAGHGRSQHRSSGSFYHLWDYALDIVSILNKSKQSVWLVGHSMGGAVATLVAALASDKVKGLILLDNIGPLSDSSENRVTTLQRAINKMMKHRVERIPHYSSKDDMILARMKGFTKLSEAASRVLVERGAKKLECGAWGWRHDRKLTFPSPFYMDEESVKSFIQEIKCPTLLLIANEGVYKDDSFFVKKRTADFSQLTIKWLDGGHHFHLEPDTCVSVATEIQKFVDQN